MVSGTEWSDNNGTFTAATTTTTMSQQRIVTTGDGDNSDCSTNSTSTGLFTFASERQYVTLPHTVLVSTGKPLSGENINSSPEEEEQLK